MPDLHISVGHFNRYLAKLDSNIAYIDTSIHYSYFTREQPLTQYPRNINKFRNKNVLAFAGIGNPENFFDLLKKNKLNVKKKFIFQTIITIQKKNY